MARLFRRDTARPSFARRLLRARDGSTAIEFALIALPFFMLLFAILEIGLLLLLDAVVETAAADTGRLVRTGQIQMQNLTPEKMREVMKAKLCSEMSVFANDCATRAYLDVRVVNDFSTPLDEEDPMASGKLDKTKIDVKPGQPGDMVMVRIWYEHPIVTPFMQQALTKAQDGKVMLTTTMAFRNEPFL